MKSIYCLTDNDPTIAAELLIEIIGPGVSKTYCNSDLIKPYFSPTKSLTAAEYQAFKEQFPSPTTGLPIGFDANYAASLFAGGFGLVVSTYVLAYMVGSILRVIRTA